MGLSFTENSARGMHFGKIRLMTYKLLKFDIDLTLTNKTYIIVTFPNMYKFWATSLTYPSL